MTSHRNWSSRPLSLFLAVLVAAAAVLMSTLGVFDPIEDSLTSRRAELLNRQATGQVAIVEIDARSMAELRSWPWPRDYHAKVVRQLYRSGASMIAFDVDFSARSAGDEEFADAVKDAGNVVLPIFAQQASGNGVRDTRVLASRPDAAFADAWVGGVNIFPGRDGVVRDYPAALVIDGSIQPSIATLLADNSKVGDLSFQPDWSINTGSIPRFSFVDVMNGRVPAKDFKDKRVVIGATAIELGDRYAVPRYGVVPGVVVQALAAESLLQDRPIQRTGFPVTIAGALLIALLLSPRPLRRPVRYGALSAGVLAAIVGGPVIVQELWPLSVDSAAWLATWALAVGVQVSVEAQRRLRLRAQFDSDSGLPNRSSLERMLVSDDSRAFVLVTAAVERFEVIRNGIGLTATNELIRSAADRVGAMTEGPVYRIAPDVIAWTIPDGARLLSKSRFDASRTYSESLSVPTPARSTSRLPSASIATRTAAPQCFESSARLPRSATPERKV